MSEEPRREKAIYSIGAVARMLNIPAGTLRAWEERYGILVPSRSDGAQRLYSRAQVEQLRYIKSQIDVGVSAADAHRLLADELATGSVPASVSAEHREAPVILIAERDGYAAELAEYFLRTEGYEVAVALNAAQASLHFAERAPQLVVVDLLIGGGAGFRLVREFSKAGSSRVLAVSAIDSADESLRCGADAFMRKPLEPLTLVSTVRDLLGTSALTRTAQKQPAGP